MKPGSARRTRLSLTIAILASTVPIVVLAQFWPQWALNPQHTGQVAVAGQPLNTILAQDVYDPLVPDEMAAVGALTAHYQVPVVDDTAVFMEFKSGTYNKNRNPRAFCASSSAASFCQPERRLLHGFTSPMASRTR